MGVDVHKPRRHGMARGIHCFVGVALQIRRDLGDLAVNDGDVGRERRRPRPINHGAITNDQIKHGLILVLRCSLRHSRGQPVRCWVGWDWLGLGGGLTSQPDFFSFCNAVWYA